MTEATRSRGARVRGTGIAAALVLCASVLADAGDARACAGDRPCFAPTVQGCRSIVFDFGVVRRWDHFNVRYQADDGPRQQENRSGIHTMNGTSPGRTYTLSVQGCRTRTFGSSSCSPWAAEWFTTAPADPTCQAGFVWREARPGDVVCVTPGERSRAARENRDAPANRQPGGGPSGPHTCRSGLVWREAFPGDVVCVAPHVRTLTRRQNESAAGRRVCG